MKNYLTPYLQKAYDFFHPEYARDMRMAEFKLLKESGELEQMCSSEVHELFGITRISDEF